MKIEKCVECQEILIYEHNNDEASFFHADCYHDEGIKFDYFYYEKKNVTNYTISQNEKRFTIRFTENLAYFKFGYGIPKDIFSFEINNMSHKEIMNKFNQLISFV